MLPRSRRSFVATALAIALIPLLVWVVAASAALTTSWSHEYTGPANYRDAGDLDVVVSADLRAVSAADSAHVWAVGWYQDGSAALVRPLVVSGLAGPPWAEPKLASFTGALNGVDAVSVTNVWAVGDAGLILKWNGGTWARYGSGITAAKLNAVSFSDASNGWAVGAGGVILRTTDGGSTWAVSVSGTVLDLYGVSAPSSSMAVAVGASGVTLRWDGSAWQSVTSAGAQALRSVAFPDASHGWVVGDANTFLSWNAVSHSWTVQDAPFSNFPGYSVDDMRPNAVAFSGTRNGIAVGESAVFWRTADGGVTWESDRLPSGVGESGNLRMHGVAIAPDDATRIWIAAQSDGPKGTVLGGTLSVEAPTTGSLSGNVTATGGAALAGVSVTVGALAPVTTTTGGAYTVSGVAVGTYSVTYAKTGYVSRTITGVGITAGGTATQNVELAATPPAPGLHPVWRFYNMRNGAHFYTANPDEKVYVQTQLGATYRLEIVAFQVNFSNPANNAPLYRFFNMRAGVHFYTANPDEMLSVRQNQAQTYRFENAVYNVCPTAADGAIPVFRFFKFKQGVHFYTANPDESVMVQRDLWRTYNYEGINYYIAP